MTYFSDKVNTSERVAAIPLDAKETLPLDAMSGVVLCTPAAALAGAEVAALGVGAFAAGATIGDAID
jgi:hypothetical protein